MNLEDALRRALAREQPPTGFTERVLAITGERRRRASARTWIAIAAMFAVGAIVTTEFKTYENHRQAEGRKAGRELAIALKITGSKLHVTSRMIRRRSNGV